MRSEKLKNLLDWSRKFRVSPKLQNHDIKMSDRDLLPFMHREFGPHIHRESSRKGGVTFVADRAFLQRERHIAVRSLLDKTPLRREPAFNSNSTRVESPMSSSSSLKTASLSKNSRTMGVESPSDSNMNDNAETKPSASFTRQRQRQPTTTTQTTTTTTAKKRAKLFASRPLSGGIVSPSGRPEATRKKYDVNRNNLPSTSSRMTMVSQTQRVAKDQVSLRSLKIIEEVDDIIHQQGKDNSPGTDKISAFAKPNSQKAKNKNGSKQPAEQVRFHRDIPSHLNINQTVSGAVGTTRGDAKDPPMKKKKLVASQVTSSDRMARSKYRRDPIHERLLFLTGHSQHQIQNPDYVKHLDGILRAKHDEKESNRQSELAEAERDREWLWSVKYDLDFTQMEKATLEAHRVERKEAAEAELNRQDAMFSSAGKQTFYSIATRTHGLDKMRNISQLKAMHEEIIRENVKKGLANPRCTWLLHTMENEDDALAELLAAETVNDLYLASEKTIQDTMTLAEQDEEEGVGQDPESGGGDDRPEDNDF